MIMMENSSVASHTCLSLRLASALLLRTQTTRANRSIPMTAATGIVSTNSYKTLKNNLIYLLYDDTIYHK